jgi:hypothetical protein
VDKVTFARLLGIQSIDGFVEIGSVDKDRFVPPDVDFENVRPLVHVMGQFRRGCTSVDIENCRWANRRVQNGK